MKILSKEYLFIGNIQSSALLKKWDMRDELEKQQYQDVLTMECTIEPGGYISWGEWDVATWEIIRTSSALSQDNEELNELKEYTSTLGKTRPGPSFISSGFVVPSSSLASYLPSIAPSHISPDFRLPSSLACFRFIH